MRVQRLDEHRPMPWANGRGTSYEVARGGGDDWAWRVAIAPVVEDGPFSVLPGVDRWLVVMDDAPMHLDIDGAERVARRGEVVAFSGESKVAARVPLGPTRDCGLMVRRSTARGDMRIVEMGRCDGTVVVALERSRVRSDSTVVELAAGDALVGDAPCGIEILSGRVAVMAVGT
jgi:environmental stress-induced protein Ves